jgi:hypothetical protein
MKPVYYVASFTALVEIPVRYLTSFLIYQRPDVIDAIRRKKTSLSFPLYEPRILSLLSCSQFSFSTVDFDFYSRPYKPTELQILHLHAGTWLIHRNLSAPYTSHHTTFSFPVSNKRKSSICIRVSTIPVGAVGDPTCSAGSVQTVWSLTYGDRNHHSHHPWSRLETTENQGQRGFNSLMIATGRMTSNFLHPTSPIFLSSYHRSHLVTFSHSSPGLLLSTTWQYYCHKRDKRFSFLSLSIPFFFSITFTTFITFITSTEIVLSNASLIYILFIPYFYCLLSLSLFFSSFFFFFFIVFYLSLKFFFFFQAGP